MFEQLVLGTIQGITEWLPISSKSMIILAQKNFFNHNLEVTEILRVALLLHLGTLLAALVHFRKDVIKLLNVVLKPKEAKVEDKKVFQFLFIATLVSGILGGIFFKGLESVEGRIQFTGQVVNAIVGALLLFTGWIQIKAKRANKMNNLRTSSDLKIADGVILGLTQGFAAIPGFSRSGLTVAALLLRKFDDMEALRLSFLMSMPIVLAGNIILNYDHFGFYPADLVGIAASFVFGFLTIRWLLSVARRVNFGYFVIFFGALLVLAGLI